MHDDFFEAVSPGPGREAILAAMLEVDRTALRLRVAIAKADLQMRSASCAQLQRSTVERLLSWAVREEQRKHLEELRRAVQGYAHILTATGSSPDEVVELVKETVEGVIPAGAPESETTIDAAVTNAREICTDTRAA